MLMEWMTTLTFCVVTDYVWITQQDTVRTDRVQRLSADRASDGDWVWDPACDCVPLDDWEDGLFDLHINIDMIRWW